MIHKENISDELLAAWLDGNTTPEEDSRIRNVAQFSEDFRKIIAVARSGLGYENEIEKEYAYAASSIDRNVLCCILSEKYILNKKGIDVAEDSLIEIAVKNGWFHPRRGTPTVYIGKLLEWHGVGVARKFGTTIECLKEELQAGRFVIAYIDGGELTDDWLLEMAEDEHIGEIPDHVVIVADIDLEKSQTVTVYDFSTENESDTYPVEQFMDSWADSNFYMISIE